MQRRWVGLDFGTGDSPDAIIMTTQGQTSQHGTRSNNATPTITTPRASAVAYAPDYTTYLTVDPTNEANVTFTPPLTMPVPAGSTTGSITVAIVNPQFPQQ